MKSTLLLSIAAMSALTMTSANAHDNNCNINLDGNLHYYKSVLTVDMENGSTMTITPDYALTINGEYVALNNEQQRWVSDYYDSIDTAIPMTLSLVEGGLEIATVAVGDVFGELLGDDDLSDDFSDMFSSLDSKIQTSFYDDQGNVRIDSTQNSESGWFDAQWEAEFEQELESLITRSMGKILVSIGTQMLWGDGDMSEFEQRMERFGEDIEQRVELQAAELEDDAEALCSVLTIADNAETKMSRGIAGLDGLDLLDMKSDEPLRM